MTDPRKPATPWWRSPAAEATAVVGLGAGGVIGLIVVWADLNHYEWPDRHLSNTTTFVISAISLGLAVLITFLSGRREDPLKEAPRGPATPTAIFPFVGSAGAVLLAVSGWTIDRHNWVLRGIPVYAIASTIAACYLLLLATDVMRKYVALAVRPALLTGERVLLVAFTLVAGRAAFQGIPTAGRLLALALALPLWIGILAYYRIHRIPRTPSGIDDQDRDPGLRA